MLNFLQQNAEWMSAIALVFFAYIQCKITHNQVIQELKLKRLEIAQQLDKIGANFLGNSETAMELFKFLGENQSSFKFLLRKEYYKHVEELCGFVWRVRNTYNITQEQQLENIKLCNKYLNDLTDALCNADYGMVKYKEPKIKRA